MQSEDRRSSHRAYLEIRNVTKTWGSCVALDHVSLDVQKGEFVSILGPSGCGKTTLLRVVAGLEEPDAGRIHLDGKDISCLPPAKRGCGIVFQSYALFPNLTAMGNASYGIKGKGLTRAQTIARAQKMLDLVGIGELGHKYPAQMSGGQQQRVALARALAIEPSILLLDEPLSALDARVRERLRQEIRRLQERLGVTTIMVTHDQEEALTMADRIIVMNEGRLIQYATPQEVYHDPMDAFVADFVGTMNFMKRWHVNGNDTVTFGGVSLQTAKHISRILTGEDVTLAIRPEDVRILKRNDSDTNTLQATVEGVEFRGSFYRVRFRIQAEGDYSGAPFLEADLQSSIVRQLGVRQGVSLSVQLPPDRLHFFPEKTQHPYNCA